MSLGLLEHQMGACRLETVSSEMLKFLARVIEVDLATIYRSMAELFGAGAVLAVSGALGRLVRAGAIEIETRYRSDFEPLVGIVRLARPDRPS